MHLRGYAMHFARCLLYFSCLLLGQAYASFCQEKSQHEQDTITNEQDTTKARQIIEDIKNSKVSRKLVKTITKKHHSDPGATIKSEEFFLPYEGRIIRNIFIQRVSFGKSVTDTTRNIRNLITKVANRVHSNSKEWLIKDHLFIREDKELNPYKVADNERYLRDLDFIMDAKIFVIPLRHTKDSVDLIVRTRDVFSIGGSFNPASPTKTRFKVYDVNLFGMGQRVQFNGLVDARRQPAFGYEFLYRKNSVGGSFITATGGYTQLNTGSSYGNEEEKAYYLRLERPLVSPYTRFAGAMEISRNWSQNFYGAPDDLFRKYRYLVNDFWVGYNIGALSNFADRNRHFVAIRVFDQHFVRSPAQDLEENNPIYSNRTYVLGGLTFFKQNFYTARYIYGFGRTEDIPYGHTMSFYFGWARQLGLERPYVGIDYGQSVVSRKGQFYNIAFRAGAYNNSGLEDASVLVSSTLTSRLISYRRLLMRQTIGSDFTTVYNQRTSLPLDINNEFGLRGFVTDSLWGTKRFHIMSETLVFTPLQILGFKLAPFTFGEMAWIAPKRISLFKDDPYFGIGGGIRTRNENLVFGTIELRFIYYPRTVADLNSFTIRLSSNLRVKYTATFVKPPSFVQYN
jgi:hypothetical protein